MADEAAAEGGGGGGDEGGAPPKAGLKLDLATILVVGNLVFFLGALGTLVYTKLLFKRPVIEESEELKKKKAESKDPLPVAEHQMVPFDSMTLNIAMTSGKAHYVTLSFALECKNNEVFEFVKKRKAVFTDKLVLALAHRQVTELSTIQGKLFLKNELLREYNALLLKQLRTPGAILGIYFPTFVLQ